VDGTGSGSCAVVGSTFSSDKPLGSATIAFTVKVQMLKRVTHKRGNYHDFVAQSAPQGYYRLQHGNVSGCLCWLVLCYERKG
jgi:hypothetical protein